MSVVITNPAKLPDYTMSGKLSCVSTLKIWLDVENMWSYYYYQHSLPKGKDPRNEIEGYFGSSKGKNEANSKMLKAMELSSKDVECELDKLCETPIAAYYEQLLITMHNWPLGGGHKESEDCWNQNNGVGKYTKHPKNMTSIIKYKMLSRKLKKQLDTENPESIFKVGTVAREVLRQLIAGKRFIQSRARIEGNKEQIAFYAEQMRKLFSWKEWDGYVILLMNKDGSIWKILDGNESAHACLRVPNIKKLRTIEIPHEEWIGIIEADLESIGNECNKYPNNRKDYIGILDAERNIRNLIAAHKLITPIRKNNTGGNPQLNHPIIDERMNELGLGEREIKLAKNTIEKEYKDKKSAERKREEGSADFSDEALKVILDDDGKVVPNGNLKKYIETRAGIWKNLKNRFDITNTIKISAGANIPGGIGKKLDQFFGSKYPKEVLVLLEFKFISDYKNFSNIIRGKSSAIKRYKKLYSGVTNLTIRKLKLT